jgi:hypothetical protein
VSAGLPGDPLVGARSPGKRRSQRTRCMPPGLSDVAQSTIGHLALVTTSRPRFMQPNAWDLPGAAFSPEKRRASVRKARSVAERMKDSGTHGRGWLFSCRLRGFMVHRHDGKASRTPARDRVSPAPTRERPARAGPLMRPGRFELPRP